MSQQVEFPYLPPGEPHGAVGALIRLCRDLPPEGERFPEFRSRMKELRLWDRERMAGTWTFLDLERTGIVEPSPVMRKVRASKSDDAAREVLAQRLWAVNPLVFKTVVERLSERVHPRDELIKYFDSYAYRGERPSRPALEDWIKLALGLEVIKLVGIALGLDQRGKAFLDAAGQLDIDEFLEDEAGGPGAPAPAGEAGAGAADADAGDGAGLRGAGSGDGDGGEPVAADRAGERGGGAAAQLSGSRTAVVGAGLSADPFADLPSPRGHGRPVEPARFAGHGVFPPDVLAETTERIAGWWAEHGPGRQGAAASDFGFEPEQWLEDAPALLYRLAVAAALVFRLPGRDAALAAYRALAGAGILTALYEGTAPDALPGDLDARALMLASVVARRCAEAPELAAALEAQPDAAAVFARLGEAFGRGLLRLELFWIAGALADIGAVRVPDIADYTAIPHRPVRDALFRLGYLATPYAPAADDLAAAARAARHAAGAAAPPDEAVYAFALAAGCGYDCPHRRACDLACRERAG